MDDRILELVATEVARRLAGRQASGGTTGPAPAGRRCAHDPTRECSHGPDHVCSHDPASGAGHTHEGSLAGTHTHAPTGPASQAAPPPGLADASSGPALDLVGATVTLGISGHHVHLSSADCEALFGTGNALTPQRALIQPGQFAARESVTVVGPKGSIPNVRVVGPLRRQTQVEISRSDGFVLGIDAPVRVSGHIAGSAACVLVGPRGAVLLDEGVIVAARHLHLEPERAAALGLADGDEVEVAADGTRPGMLSRIVVRSGKDHKAEIHVDTDEANALGLSQGQPLRVTRRGPARPGR